jgi:hypothetical protein
MIMRCGNCLTKVEHDYEVRTLLNENDKLLRRVETLVGFITVNNLREKLDDIDFAEWESKINNKIGE